MNFQHWSRILLPQLGVAGLVGAVAISASAASASVLVTPRVRQDVRQEVIDTEVPNTEVPNTEIPSTEIPAPPTNAVEPSTAQSLGTIVEVASNTDEFSTLTSAITVANIGSILSDEGPLTVFAPTDSAFAALPAGTLDSLLLPENRDLLVKLLYNHVSYGDLSSEALITGQTGGQVDTFDGTVDVAATPTGVQVGEATVVQADVAASNGVIHAVDKVLLPAGFTDQLQARVDGTEDSSQVQTSTQEEPATTVNQPSTPASSSVSGPSGDSTVEPVEPSTADDEDTPVRALW